MFMPNETQIECYFKSAEMAKLCKAGDDIVIHFKASYPPDSPPTFTISADSYTKGVKKGKSVKSSAPSGPGFQAGGCPTPCQ